jgi:hypothetical protein
MEILALYSASDIITEPPEFAVGASLPPLGWNRHLLAVSNVLHRLDCMVNLASQFRRNPHFYHLACQHQVDVPTMNGFLSRLFQHERIGGELYVEMRPSLLCQLIVYRNEFLARFNDLIDLSR